MKTSERILSMGGYLWYELANEVAKLERVARASKVLDDDLREAYPQGLDSLEGLKPLYDELHAALQDCQRERQEDEMTRNHRVIAREHKGELTFWREEIEK